MTSATIIALFCIVGGLVIGFALGFEAALEATVYL